jgi:zinc protease
MMMRRFSTKVLGSIVLIVALVGMFLPSNAIANGDVTMKYLDNGLRVLFKKNPNNNILAMNCFVDIGSLYEEESEHGITNFVQKVLTKGTHRRTAEQIAEEMESIGGVLAASAAEDYASVSTVTTVEDIDRALDIFTDVLFHPSFPMEEVEKERKNILAEMRLRDDSQFYFTYRHLKAVLYQGHPYAFPVEGDAETVQGITRDQLVGFHDKYWVPSNMILSVVGNLDEEVLMNKLRKYFAEKYQAPPLKMTVRKEFKNRRQTVTLEKDVEQGFLAMGYVTVDVKHKDYPALKVLSAILGEGMSSRFFVHLRDQQGLAYVVGSAMPTRELQGHIFGYIGTKPETLENAREAMLKEFNLAQQQLTDEEVERAKRYIIGNYLIDHETNARQAYYLGWFEIIGAGWQFDQEYPKAIEKVTKQEVLDVARRYLSDPITVVLKPQKPAH